MEIGKTKTMKYRYMCPDKFFSMKHDHSVIMVCIQQKYNHKPVPDSEFILWYFGYQILLESMERTMKK